MAVVSEGMPPSNTPSDHPYSVFVGEAAKEELRRGDRDTGERPICGVETFLEFALLRPEGGEVALLLVATGVDGAVGAMAFGLFCKAVICASI